MALSEDAVAIIAAIAEVEQRLKQNGAICDAINEAAEAAQNAADEAALLVAEVRVAAEETRDRVAEVAAAVAAAVPISPNSTRVYDQDRPAIPVYLVNPSTLVLPP